MTANQKLIAKLETLEKRAATLAANAKTYTEQGRAGSLKATARHLRASLVAQGIL